MTNRDGFAMCEFCQDNPTKIAALSCVRRPRAAAVSIASGIVNPGILLTVWRQNAYTAALRYRQVQAIKEIADGSHQAYRTRDRRSGKDR
jgi:hypothetical protein